MYIYYGSSLLAMEWRVFFPTNSGDTEISNRLARCEQLLNNIVDPEGLPKPEEVREDSYIVVDRRCGLKYRHGKKLEVKINNTTEHNNYGIEQWEKYKLKKKPIDEQIDTLMHLLTNSFTTPPDPRDYRCVITADRRVTVLKRRRIKIFENVSFEFCNIEIQSSTDSSLSKNWISIDVESTSEDAIRDFIKGNSSLREALSLLAGVIQGFSNSSSINSPIVSGYPFWVQLVAGLATSDEMRYHQMAFSAILN